MLSPILSGGTSLLCTCCLLLLLPHLLSRSAEPQLLPGLPMCHSQRRHRLTRVCHLEPVPGGGMGQAPSGQQPGEELTVDPGAVGHPQGYQGARLTLMGVAGESGQSNNTCKRLTLPWGIGRGHEGLHAHRGRQQQKHCGRDRQHLLASKWGVCLMPPANIGPRQPSQHHHTLPHSPTQLTCRSRLPSGSRSSCPGDMEA